MKDQEFVGLGNISLSKEEMKNGRVIGMASHPNSPMLLLQEKRPVFNHVIITLRLLCGEYASPSNYFPVAFLPKTAAVPRPPHGLLFVSCLMCRED